MSCSRCKFQRRSNLELPCLECTGNRAIDYFKPMTNADRIRNMSDEELAEFLEGFTICDHCEYYKNERCTLDNPCVHGFAQAMAQKWLQAEVDGDE